LPPQAAEKFECPRLTKVARALAALRGEQTVTATILPRMSKARSRAGTSGPARVPAGLEGVSSIQQGRRVTLGGTRSLDLALSIEVAEVSFGLLFRQHRSAQFA